MSTKFTTGDKLNPAMLHGDSPYRNHLLVAMPTMQGDTFHRSVIYMCAHSDAGAMGIVVNQKLPEIEFRDLLQQLQLPTSEVRVNPTVHFGGPVETGRGFVLHSTDFVREDTVHINGQIAVTGTVDILRAISEGHGPQKSIFALGYAGWGPGQLDAEMQGNNWLVVPADEDLIFNPNLANKWERALMKLGIDPISLSMESGRA